MNPFRATSFNTGELRILLTECTCVFHATLGINSEYHIHSCGKICLRHNDLLNHRTDILKKDTFMKRVIVALAAVTFTFIDSFKEIVFNSNGEVKN